MGSRGQSSKKNRTARLKNKIAKVENEISELKQKQSDLAIKALDLFGLVAKVARSGQGKESEQRLREQYKTIKKELDEVKEKIAQKTKSVKQARDEVLMRELSAKSAGRWYERYVEGENGELTTAKRYSVSDKKGDRYSIVADGNKNTIYKEERIIAVQTGTSVDEAKAYVEKLAKLRK